MDLSRVTVLDLTRLLPGPFATQLLADLGADVIKIEDPKTGDYARDLPPLTEDGIGTIFDAVNRGKRSVAIDLKTAAGQSVFYELLDDADVVFEGFRPGVTDRLGVDEATLRAYNPEVVYCSLSGFGQTGPLADTVGHDLTYEGYSGLLDLTREDGDSAPQIPGFPMADMAGGLVAAFSIVGGLLSRELGAGGEYIDVSLTEALSAFGQPVASDALGEDPPEPGSTEFTGALPWYDVYETADGGYVTLAALEPRFWTAFCEAVGREDLEAVHGTTDGAERAALRFELESLFASRSREEWVAQLEEVPATVGPVLSFDEALRHPHFVDRELVRGRDSGAPRLGFPALVDGIRPGVDAPSPDLGAHTREVLLEAGVDSDRVEKLLAEDVLART